MKTIIGVAALTAIVATVPACTGAKCYIETGIPLREMPDVDMLVGDTKEIPLKGHFSLPPGCVESFRDDGYVIFEARSSDPSAVAVTMADLTTLEIVAHEEADSVRVTVVSIDQEPYGHEFVVRVRAR